MIPHLRRVVRLLGIIVLLGSLSLNLILFREFIPLLPYYDSYWDLRAWISVHLLGRERPDTARIYQSTDFTLQPSPGPTPTYQLQEILEAEDPAKLADQLRADLRGAFALERIPRG